MGLVKTHQKPTVKPTPNRSPSEKPNPARCGFSNRKPTPTHTIPTSIHLWFNFLDDRLILMFFVNNQIMSSSLYLDENILFSSAYLLCVFYVFANSFLIKSQMFFIFSVIVFVFCVNIRSLIDNWSIALVSEELKLIRSSNS